MNDNLALGLLHHDMLNKAGDTVTTAITSFDLHDISRLSKTYELDRFYVINPLAAQKEIMGRIIDHWHSENAKRYNAKRTEAFSRTVACDWLADTVADIEKRIGKKPLLVATDAKVLPNSITYQEMRTKLEARDEYYLLVFGTGWGMRKELLSQFDYILGPINGVGCYNHLSVRSAAAIIIDRLCGDCYTA